MGEARSLTNEEAAVLLVARAQSAIAKGTRFFHPRTNELLPSAVEVLACMQRHGEVNFFTAEDGFPN